jgi:type IV pilus assembly protein PilE
MTSFLINNKTHERGFTLIELMIAIVIVSILVGIALPSYTEFVRKGKRADAMAALLDAANRQEQFMLDRNTYSATLAGIGLTNPTTDGNYNLTINAATGACPINRCFSMTATAINEQASDDSCTSFTLTSAGVKTATGTKAADCWTR